MADNKNLTRKQARKLAEKENKRRRKEEHKAMEKEMKAARASSRKKASKNKKKVVIKKRFYVMILAFAVVLALIVFCAVKIITNVMGPSANDKDEVPEDPNSVEAVVNVNEVYDSADPALMYSPVGEDSEGKDDEDKKDGESDDPDDKDGKGDKPEDASKYSMEYQICTEIISNWQISPLTQTEEVVAQTFGELTRYEDWAGGIYYHKGFPETMYVSYGGNVIDDKPQSDAICDAVSVCLKSIIQFEEFTPNPSVWGEIHEDKSGEGWTDYFYSLLIREGVNLIVYCDEDGSVDQETHIIVRKV